MWPDHLLKDLCVSLSLEKDITRWILTFYTNINSCVHVNGQYSQWFDLKRGTRQGDALSPYFFLICAELLASLIHQNPTSNVSTDSECKTVRWGICQDNHAKS